MPKTAPKAPPKITAAEKRELLQAIDDIKFVIDASIDHLATLRYSVDKANACVAEEIGQQRQRLSFWDQQRRIVDLEPTS